MGGGPTSANFGFLRVHDELLVSLGAMAERYFASDAPTALIKLRQFAEVLAQHVAAHVNQPRIGQESFADLEGRLHRSGHVPREARDLFATLRKLGNAAAHEAKGTSGDALGALKLARQLGVWFHTSYGGQPAFKAGPFIPPAPPADATAPLVAELAALKKALDAATLSAEQAVAAKAEEARRRLDAEARAAKDAEDAKVWESLAQEAEAKLAAKLSAEARQAATQKPAQVEARVQRVVAAGAAIQLDEADTRRLIDAQLRDARWEADSQQLTYASGARPVAGRNLAIAEWPMPDLRADYVLFVGLTPVAVVEAKRKHTDVSGSLVQAQEYAEAFEAEEGGALAAEAPWGKVKVPFLLASNARPYFKQLDTKSGIWFRDARKSTNLPRALTGWPTPEGLTDKLKQDIDAANAKLKAESAAVLPGLRPYQMEAIEAVEKALIAGKREVLVAMATGTGKTRTFIGLIYRLLKTARFKRVLFLVDRNALGTQATTAFQTEFVEGVQKFSDIFNLKELSDRLPAPDTRLHFATVQAVAKRLGLDAGGEGTSEAFSDEAPLLHVDDYDCIVVDECHRGYVLDKELSEGELTFRDPEAYLSVYRRVLESFDAVKIGLTATPALHTASIFGEPVFYFKYRQAVVGGWLVDHPPAFRINTKLKESGIRFERGEQVHALTPTQEQLLLTMPDEVAFDVESFNRQVVTEDFNRVVCEALAKEIDPALPAKTLIFCANDAHADLVVKLLSEAFQKQYGTVDADAVQKITGKARNPEERIRRLKNEKLPSVAVTVDLLTTGIDVPAICNLVFLRRVKSRILYDQMIGRATRLFETPDFVKESFRIFDPVDLYKTLENVTNMKPVVVNPSFTFAQLADELAKLPAGDARTDVAEQFLAKLMRKKRAFEGAGRAELFEAAAGASFDEAARTLRSADAAAVVAWLQEHPSVVPLLDRLTGAVAPTLISNKPDEFIGMSQGFGPGQQRPEDFLEAFGRFLREQQGRLATLQMVTQRPRELTRKALQELKLALDAEGYSEAQLRAAYRATTNADVAASLMGFIRQKALGEPLKPYAQRVDEGLSKVKASRVWTSVQLKWLERLGDAIKNNEVVDRPLLDEGAFQSDGGFARIDKVFEGRLAEVLGELQEAVWARGG